MPCTRVKAKKGTKCSRADEQPSYRANSALKNVHKMDVFPLEYFTDLKTDLLETSDHTPEENFVNFTQLLGNTKFQANQKKKFDPSAFYNPYFM